MFQNWFLFQKIECILSLGSSHHILHHFIWTFSFIKEPSFLQQEGGNILPTPSASSLAKKIKALSYKISILTFSWTVSFSISFYSSFPRITLCVPDSFTPVVPTQPSTFSLLSTNCLRSFLCWNKVFFSLFLCFHLLIFFPFLLLLNYLKNWYELSSYLCFLNTDSLL